MNNKTIFKHIVLTLLLFAFSASFSYGQVCGDFDRNGTTNIIDALLVAQCYVKIIECSSDVSDVNCDGTTNIIDALLIAQYYVKLLSQLACCSTPTPFPTQIPTPSLTPSPTPIECTHCQPIPGIIEAESYTNYGGNPNTEPNNEPSGVHISYIQPGEWLEYEVNVTEENFYIHFRTASASDTSPNRIGSVEMNGVDITGPIDFPLTGGWTTFKTTTFGPVKLTPGPQIMRITFDGEGFNFDLVEFKYTTDTPSPVPTPTPTPSPTPTCNGTCPPVIPVILNVEDYDRIKENESENYGKRLKLPDGLDLEDNWEGGFNTCWVAPGEWLEWDVNIIQGGAYNVWLRVAHDASADCSGKVEINGDLVGEVVVPNTDPYGVGNPGGHWQSWVNVLVGYAQLSEGLNVVHLEHTGTGGFNVGRVYLLEEFVEPPMPSSVPKPAGYIKPVDKYGQLQVIGTNLCDSTGTPIQLRGVSTHDFRWHWLAKKHTIQNLAYSHGVPVFRLAMYVDPNNGGYVANGHRGVLRERLFAYIKDAIEAGIYVIVDWHVLKDQDPNKYKSESKAFFKEVSEMYGQYPNIIWEICNEPNGPSWSRIKQYANEVIPVIRTNDPDNIIIVGTPTWSSDVHIASQNPITGHTNIMYAFHFYAGSHTQNYRNQGNTALANGIAIFVTEWGTVGASGTGSPNFTESQKWIDWMEANNISWINWAFCNKDEGASILKVPTGITGPWSDAELTSTGRWIMDRIK